MTSFDKHLHIVSICQVSLIAEIAECLRSELYYISIRLSRSTLLKVTQVKEVSAARFPAPMPNLACACVRVLKQPSRRNYSL